MARFSKSQSFGDRYFTQNSIVPSRLKRNSVGKHKTTVSLDAYRLIALPSASPNRPASSSGIPLIDTKLKPPTPAERAGLSPLSFSRGWVRGSSTNIEDEIGISQATASMKVLEMESGHHRNDSHSTSGFSSSTLRNSIKSRRNDSGLDSTQNKRYGKQGWLSQLKGWISVSEPSAQALKQYKRETYKKAHIALDDPQAKAKLHLPIGVLPHDAIKPAGRGPDPEDIAPKEAEQRKLTPQSDNMGGGASRGLQSSPSQYSSSSSVAFSAANEDTAR